MLSSMTTLLRNPHFLLRGEPAPGGPSGFSTYSQKDPYTLVSYVTHIYNPFFFTILWLFFRCITGDSTTRDGRQGGFTAVATRRSRPDGEQCACKVPARHQRGLLQVPQKDRRGDVGSKRAFQVSTLHTPRTLPLRTRLVVR